MPIFNQVLMTEAPSETVTEGVVDWDAAILEIDEALAEHGTAIRGLILTKRRGAEIVGGGSEILIAIRKADAAKEEIQE